MKKGSCIVYILHECAGICLDCWYSPRLPCRRRQAGRDEQGYLSDPPFQSTTSFILLQHATSTTIIFSLESVAPALHDQAEVWSAGFHLSISPSIPVSFQRQLATSTCKTITQHPCNLALAVVAFITNSSSAVNKGVKYLIDHYPPLQPQLARTTTKINNNLQLAFTASILR